MSLYDGSGNLAWSKGSSDGVKVDSQTTFEVNDVLARTLRVQLSGQSPLVLELREVQAFTDDDQPPRVPEPTTMLLLGLGLIGLAGVRRRMHK